MAFQRKRRCPVLLRSAFLPLLFSTIRTCKCQECGGNFTNASGTITSPNFPEPYPNNLTCIYLIARPEALLPYQPLLVTAHDGIYRLDVETGIYTPIPILSTSTFLAIALDPLDDRVYWSTSYSINSAFPNGSDIIKHYNFDFGRSSKCSGLALDYLSHLLFFADMNNGVIGLIDIPSSHVSEVLSTDLEGPSDLALDIVNNVIYWTQIGTSPKIERANYDGSDRRTIVTSVDRPYAITLDLDRGYLYWVDALSGAVGRSDLEGNYSTVIYSLPDFSDTLYALGLKDDMLYVIQSSIYTFPSLSFSFLYKVNTTTGISAGNLSFHEFTMKDMIVLDQNIVVRSPNRCDVDNGGCPIFVYPSLARRVPACVQNTCPATGVRVKYRVSMSLVEIIQ
ncbi:hypothetical protein C0Q70_02989 [Pomacea canaliculata]|uniref:CUB domain-containing protein n=1 Tax=Pomacea canaliculata TaxID=400727 RepID=A0A2T7PRG9_POMCA|nr:hypothetical protein C0Q70_02989 [Pomacea canaliculata]